VPRILFIRGGAIGDFILTLPAMQLVRDMLPEVELEVLGYDSISHLAVASGIAVETRSIEYAPMANFFAPRSDLDPALQEYFKSFSVVVSYLYDPDGFFRDNLIRAGVKRLIEASHRVDDLSAEAEPAARQLAKPLESLALYLEKPFVDLEFPATTANASRSEKNTAQAQRVAIHPGSGSARKNWSADRWIQVARDLVGQNPGLEIVIVSGEAEATVIESFLSLLLAVGIEPVHAQHLPLSELGELLRSCDLFLGHDSGMSHLAAACGVPCVLLFGPTRPQVWAPQNPGVHVLAAEAGDLHKISVASVLQAAQGALAP